MRKEYVKPCSKSKRIFNTLLLAGSSTTLNYGGEARTDVPVLSRERKTFVSVFN